METRTYRAAPGAYGVFGSITAALSLLWLVAMWRNAAPWQPLLVPLGGFALVVVWLSRFRIQVGQGELTLVTPFGGKRRVALQDILSVELATETGRSESPFVLSIRTSAGEELRLNAKVFPRFAIQHLLALTPRARSPR